MQEWYPKECKATQTYLHQIIIITSSIYRTDKLHPAISTLEIKTIEENSELMEITRCDEPTHIPIDLTLSNNTPISQHDTSYYNRAKILSTSLISQPCLFPWRAYITFNSGKFGKKPFR